MGSLTSPCPALTLEKSLLDLGRQKLFVVIVTKCILSIMLYLCNISFCYCEGDVPNDSSSNPLNRSKTFHHDIVSLICQVLCSASAVTVPTWLHSPCLGCAATQASGRGTPPPLPVSCDVDALFRFSCVRLPLIILFFFLLVKIPVL